jgi:penicillin-binding protein 1A
LGQVIEPRNVAAMNTMMQETLISGTAHKAELPGWMAAGKTGTSQDFRDAWFIGYTGHLVTGVWLGNDDNSPTKKATGGGLPVEIWSRFMRAAHQGVPIAALPNSQAQGFFSGVAQAAPPSGGLQPGAQVTASQITAPNPSPTSASLAPLPPAGGYRPPPARTSTSARPEAAAGLDGWLIQRLFGGQ